MIQVAITSPTISMVQKPVHLPKLGRFVYLLATMAVIGAFLFGYDTGIVSTAILYVKKNDNMKLESDFWQELIVSITPGLAGVGSLIAGPTSDRFGRRTLILYSTVVFAFGAIVCGGALNRYILLVGRVFLGFAIGVASMLAPIYIAECAPTRIRGKLITCFQLMLTFGMMAANIIAGAFSYINPINVGWRLMFGFAAVPAVIQFIGFLFLPESPRWLYEHRSQKECEEVLDRIYNGDTSWIHYESEEIRLSQEAQQRDVEVHGKGGFVLGRILTTPHVRKALIIGCALQIFQQLSGINTIMYYTGTIIKSAGVKDDQQTIWISVGTSSVNFICTFLPFIIVEKAGRKIVLLASVVGVFVSLCLMGGAFVLINKDSATVNNTWTMPNTNTPLDNSSKLLHCSKFSNCDFCVTDDNCGFCSVKNQRISGYCLPLASKDGNDRSSEGICSSFSTDGFHNLNGITYEWADVYCHTKWTILPIILMVVYLVAFSTGMGPIPWVLNAEFYPLWARGTCVSIATAFNWFFNLLISLTFLSLTAWMTKFGTFFFYAILTLLGFAIFFFAVPETKNKSLDEVQELFMSRHHRQNYERTKSVLSSMPSHSRKGTEIDSNFWRID